MCINKRKGRNLNLVGISNMFYIYEKKMNNIRVLLCNAGNLEGIISSS